MRAAPELAPEGGAREPRWAQPEIAWPLALLAGFAGSWLGLLTTLPGLGAVLAGVLVAPLVMPLLQRRRRSLAALCTVGWALGVGGAVVGWTLETSHAAVAAAIPGAEAWTAGEVRGFVEVPPGPLEPGAALARAVAAVALLALVSRPFVGLLGLPCLAWATSVAAAGTAWFAERAVRSGAEAVPAVLAGTPPHAALALGGALLLATGVAEPGSLLPPARLPAGRRHLLAAGLVAAAVGWGLFAVLRPAWGATLTPWLR